MKGNEYRHIDELFEAARKVPLRVPVDQVKENLGKNARGKRKPLWLSPDPLRSGWSLSLAASLALIVGLSLLFLYRSTSGGNTSSHSLVAMDVSPSQHFSLLDTYKAEPLSYWDTSSTQHVFSAVSHQNINCIQTYLADTACHIYIALELGKPDLINFFIADLTGKIVRDLLVEERQHRADSSYQFDLCHLESGKYELVVNTYEGDHIRKPIVLN